MAYDAGNDLGYWLSVEKVYKHALFPLRKWDHLKIAQEDDLIWLRGFDQAEIGSARVLGIPTISRYYLRGTQLVPYGKTLPARVEPSLLWTPIQRGLKVSLPAENTHSIGLNQTHRISLQASYVAQKITATIVNRGELGKYLHTAHHVRLQNLRWSALENNQVIIIGTPLLPISGQDLYQNGSFLLPAGWRWEFENMVEIYRNALGESQEYWFLVGREGNISKLRKADFNQLSKGSFMKTFA